LAREEIAMSKKNQSAITRRGFIRAAGFTSAGALLASRIPFSKGSGLNLFGLPAGAGAPPTPDEALKLLMEGNARYVQCEALGLNRGPKRREEQFPHQTPFAAILSCIDSRVPVEIFFDRGVGDMFVTRDAGQVLDAGEIGSIEFAVTAYHVPIVMVVGHQECGAVKAAIDYVDNPDNPPPGDILYIVRQIAPAVPPKGTPNRFEVAITNNVRMIIEKLKTRPIIAKAIADRSLKLVGAECFLKSAEVKILTA
jgi:carbonic anhydrase